MNRLELGVFLPIGNNGYLISKNAPQYKPTFALNSAICKLAEDLQFNYVFSMSKWRGFGGRTEFWDHTLESVTLMTAIAAVTKRISIIATMSPMLLHPVVAAKVAATADEVSQGRFGINVVTGASLAEYEQMGIVPNGYRERRYAYAQEWIRIVKRLWTGERVTADGDFFHLVDCVCSPRPVQPLGPFIVCAGTSPDGFRFTAEEADYSFLAGVNLEETKSKSRTMKRMAAEIGRTIKTATHLMLIIGETDEAAQRQYSNYTAGADTEAIENLIETYTKERRASASARIERTRDSVCFAGQVVVGGPETIAARLCDLAVEGELDSILLVFPNYLRDLRVFHEQVRPLLEMRGVSSVAVSADAS